MKIAFQVIDWDKIAKTGHKGETGSAFQRKLEFGGLRVRVVEYLPGNSADHWCRKGHIVYCLDGELVSEFESGEKFSLTKGMTYIVSDNLSSHRSISKKGVKLLIIDGNFLKSES
jgi:hypothetical protein